MNVRPLAPLTSVPVTSVWSVVAPRVFGALVVAAALFGCAADPIEVQVRTFVQPDALAFVCYSAANNPVPLADCNDQEASGNSLHALVTQTGRGEVASVDLRSGRVQDTNVSVPGFTFVTAGELPSALAVPVGATGAPPRYAYVANRGSLDLWAIPLERFRGARASFGAVDTVSTTEWGGIAALALAPDETALYAASPRAGVVLRFELGADGTLPDAPTSVLALPTAVPAGIDAVDLGQYCFACAPDAASPSETCGERLLSAWPESGTWPAPDPVSLGTAPSPVAFALDTESSPARLLVADANLPVVHVLDAQTGAALEPLALGVPTSAVVLSPPVPISAFDPSLGTTRYLYAIDVTDGTVLVADYPSGTVLPVTVAPDHPPDRIPLPTRAQALGIGTPDFEPGVFTNACVEGVPSALNLAGVFLFVATGDGFLRVIDVYDRLAACRADAACQVPGTADAAQVYVSRHRPRLEPLQSRAIGLGTPPFASRQSLSGTVDEDGTSLSGLTLDVVSCIPAETAVFGIEDAPRLCALADPWAAESEDWVIAFEGAIPGAAGGRGRFDSEAPGTFFAEAPFCRVGVIGPVDDLGGAPYAGDVLVLTGPTESVADGCEVFYDSMGALGQVALPILASYEDRLELADAGRVEFGDAGSAPITLVEVQTCYRGLTQYEVRPAGRYAVTGSRSGFAHRVVSDPPAPVPGPDEPGRLCVLDVSADPRQNGRARHGVPFTNGRVRFQVGGALPAPNDDAELKFSLRDVPVRMTAAVGTIPSTIAFSQQDERLYVVDSGLRGLVQYGLSPLRETNVIQ